MNVALEQNKVSISSQEFAKLVNKSLSNKVGLGLYDFPGFDLNNYFVENTFRTMPEWKKLASEAANDLIDEEGFNDFI
jgi:hypothetical protein